MDFLGHVLATSGTTAALLLIAGFLGRSQLRHWLNKDLERESNKLAAELESVKSGLQKINSEHNVKFTS